MTSGMPEFKGINSESATTTTSLHFSNVCIELRKHTDSITSGRWWYSHLYNGRSQ